jgi:hypothetical protein
VECVIDARIKKTQSPLLTSALKVGSITTLLDLVRGRVALLLALPLEGAGGAGGDTKEGSLGIATPTAIHTGVEMNFGTPSLFSSNSITDATKLWAEGQVRVDGGVSDRTQRLVTYNRLTSTPEPQR